MMIINVDGQTILLHLLLQYPGHKHWIWHQTTSSCEAPVLEFCGVWNHLSSFWSEVAVPIDQIDTF